MLLRVALVLVLLACSACQGPAAPRQEAPVPPPRAASPAQATAAVQYESPRAVYKRYAETLRAGQWPEAVELFTPAGKVELVLANFKGLALLPGSPHPKKLEFQAVLQEFCQKHALRCADAKWREVFAPTLLAGGSVKEMLSDLTHLAKAQPEATYVELMKLMQGVDQSTIMPLDPTLSQVLYEGNKASGTVRRDDGETTTMSFENTPERGWLIVE
jgi:hypothetical protein